MLMAMDDTDTNKIKLLHLSGLSWEEACDHVLPGKFASAAAICFQTWYAREIESYHTRTGHPLPRWKYDPNPSQ